MNARGRAPAALAAATGLVVAASGLLIACANRLNPPQPDASVAGDGVAMEHRNGDWFAADATTVDAPPVDAAPAHPWPTCPQWDSSGPDLAEKASILDDLIMKQHFPDGLLRSVVVDDAGTPQKWAHLPSTGLWTGMYLASQALRYAVTREPEAAQNAAKAVAGLHELTLVTGIPGLYGRGYARPDTAYTYDVSSSPTWVASTDPNHAGWYWNDDVSKDSLDGILFGLAVALEHLDDESVRTVARQDLHTFAKVFVTNGLNVIDWTGKVTEHGRLFATAIDDFPGFNALLASSWIRTAQLESGDPELDQFFSNCLMRLGDSSDCPEIDIVDPGSYMDVIESTLYVYRTDCQTSYDNIDMVYQGLYPWLRREPDPTLRKRLLEVLDHEAWDPKDPSLDPSVRVSTHTLYIFMYGGLSGVGPEDTELAQAVDEAVCTLRRMPVGRSDRDVAAGKQETACLNRLGKPNAAEIIPLEERCYDNYLWRLDPYEIPEEHHADPGFIHSPEDYLLAYWLGRYYGFLSADM